MSRAWEIAGFFAVSAAVHGVALAGLGAVTGGGASGSGGVDTVTLAAAPESLAALAERWQDAPAVAASPAHLPDRQAETTPLRNDMAALVEDLPALVQATTLPAPSGGLDMPSIPHSPAPIGAPDVADPPRLAAFAVPVPEVNAPTTVPPAPPSHGARPAGPATLSQPEAPTLGSELARAHSSRATAVSPRPVRRPDSGSVPQFRDENAPRSAPRPAQQAAGDASGTREGEAPRESAGARGPDPSLVAEWGGRIQARIQRQVPRGARAEGQLVLRLNVARSGALLSVAVVRSSGQSALDEAGIDAVRRAGRFPAAPAGLDAPSFTFDLPIAFR